MAVNVRQHVESVLRPLLPDHWKLFRYVPTDEVRNVPQVILSFTRYERNPGAPRGPRLAVFTLTLLDFHKEPGPADDHLDDELMDLLNALDEISETTNITWTTAERGTANNLPGFDINLNMPVQGLDQEAV